MGDLIKMEREKGKAELRLSLRKGKMDFEIKCPFCVTVIRGLWVFFNDEISCPRCKKSIKINDDNKRVRGQTYVPAP